MSRPTSKSTEKSLLFQFQHPEDSDSGEEASRAQGNRKSSYSSKSSGACVHCKSLKVRCEFTPGENACRRCQAGNIPCQSRSRKKRKAAPTHEDLQERAHSQDCQIQSLLLQFDRMRTEKKIQASIAHAYSGGFDGTQKYMQSRRGADNSAEVAVTSYYSPGRSLSILSPPDIVKYCCLYPSDINDLFMIFFEKIDVGFSRSSISSNSFYVIIQPFFSILDPELHTPQKLIWTCPFLFTAICATAARYCTTTKAGLYSLARDFARDAAGKALIDGAKRIDICQAYLLLGVYPSPKKKWVEDRSWLLMGVAIRMALELELHLPPPSDCDEREALNRTRTWLNCYCVDGSHAIQFGKMPMLRLDDYMARTCQDWYRSSPMNTPYDVHLVAYVRILLIMAKWRSIVRQENSSQHVITSFCVRNTSNRSQQDFDVVQFALETERQLSKEWSLWFGRYEEEYVRNPLLLCYYRANTTEMITAYLRLVILAAGFQDAFKSGISRESGIHKRSIDAARTVIEIMVERLYPTGYLKYAMEANFLYVSFSAAYLLNLLRPKLLPLLDENTQAEIVLTVERLIGVLGSEDVALDGRHTPALYSRFLVNLLSKYNTHSNRRSETPPDDIRFHPQYNEERPASSPPGWPDIPSENVAPQALSSYQPGIVYQEAGDADMDFSLGHFVRTVSELPGGQYHNIDQSHTVDSSLWNDQWPSGWSSQFKW
ncbi:fungal-specific transcription factor domain-containing protein [Lentinula aciculospora]|uniref:Fungal-specific transcription factor domain-containing protein n=1 Tax=Lentinula aciculospora TaxID=153920 RepID=A0A9W9AQ81_9AGAR|nr:fungal-specific transcription factor domain-containing protein [Lentinula aciculospora]